MGFFSKKDKLTAEDEAAKNSLFGARKTSPAPPSQNPYAAPPPPYGAPSSSAPSAGAYSGGRSPADPNREALFSGRHPGASAYPPPQSGGYGQQQQQQQIGSYGGGYSEPLTAEQEEDEDVEAVKQQIRFTKQESVASTRNALRVAAQAEESGRNTLARLGQQGELLYNTEKNLDIASSHSRVADEKARELKTVNGSMFAIHMKNPMKSKSRAEAEERRILERHQSEREERDRVRNQSVEGKGIVGSVLKTGVPGAGSYGKPQMSIAERAKYQFEADESDDEKEKEIHNNLDQLGAVTSRLKGLAQATGQEVDRQNAQISQIMRKSDKVDDSIAITHNKIKKFR